MVDLGWNQGRGRRKGKETESPERATAVTSTVAAFPMRLVWLAVSCGTATRTASAPVQLRPSSICSDAKPTIWPRSCSVDVTISDCLCHYLMPSLDRSASGLPDRQTLDLISLAPWDSLVHSLPPMSWTLQPFRLVLGFLLVTSSALIPAVGSFREPLFLPRDSLGR